MRIVAGRLKGRALAAPEGRATRPTSDRVRQALFNVLAHGIDGFTLADARVLDLFAGSGALGIEALSRGAAAAVFVETSGLARAALRENIDQFGLGGMTRILKRDARDLGPCPASGPCDLCFVDPPYAKGLGEQALASAINGGWLRDGAIICLEEAASTAIDLPIEIDVIDKRSYGATAITIGRMTTR